LYDRNSRDEAALVRRLKQRDPEALGEVYDCYGRAVFVVIARVVRDRGAAEDLTQETFLQIWNRIQGFDESRGPLGRWVLAVARNRAIDYLRSREGRQQQGMLPLAAYDRPVAPTGESDLMQFDLVRTLRGALAKLTPVQRTVLEMAYRDGLSQSEMAGRLCRPLGTVKTWVRSALQALRTEMLEYGDAKIF
jgi:RNA polymerase sigma-70 factor (ECF subfamily)